MSSLGKFLVGGVLVAGIGNLIGSNISLPASSAAAEHTVITETAPQAPIKAEVATTIPPPAKTINDYPAVRRATAMSAKGDGVAMLLNLQGELCAETVIAKPRDKPDTFTVTCAGGHQYAFNAKDGTARAL